MTNATGLPQGVPIFTLLIETPIMAYGESISELRFMRRPTAGDIMWLQDQGLEHARAAQAMIFRLCGVPMSEVEKMDGYDFNRADAVISSFLLRGPRAGKISLQSSGESSASV